MESVFVEAEDGADCTPGGCFVTFEFGDKYETVCGMGGAMAYYTNWLTNHENRDAICRAVFGGLRPTILRYRNTYRLDGCGADPVTADMRISGELQYEAEKALGYAPATLLTAWSPPPDLKASGQTAGGVGGSTIKQAEDGGFDYRAVADWWAESVQGYRNIGIPCRWVSLQNEPDYDTEHHDCCLLDMQENADEGKAGYQELVEVTHEVLQCQLGDGAPGLVGPEHTEIDGYLPTGALLDKLECVGNHMYGSGYEQGEKCDGFEKPATLLGSITNAGKWAAENCKPLFMTEFGKLSKHEHGDPLKLGQIVLETFLVGGVSAYLHWDLFWGAGGKEGSLVLIEDPWDKSKWTTECGFILTQSYYWYMHFCRYIRPGMTRVFSQSHCNGILAVAFSEENSGALTVIIINKGCNAVDELPLNGLRLGDREVVIFRSTLDEKKEKVGVLTECVLRDIPPQSIFTLTTEVSDT